jgi:predicted nucleotidyltransferase
MYSEIQNKLNDLIDICKKYNVLKLELFGSASNDRFNDSSDLDFLIQLEQRPPVEYADAYFAVKDALEYLLNRPVDLVELKAIRNPYFLQAIEKERIVLYAA